MQISGNGYTVAQIDRATERARMVVLEFPDGYVSAATVQMLIELYLGAVDADKDDAQKGQSE